MKAPKTKPIFKSYTISKPLASANIKAKKELLIIPSKWRSFARIQKIPRAQCLICIVFDEIKINRMIELYQLEGDTLYSLPGKVFQNGTSLESVRYACRIVLAQNFFDLLANKALLLKQFTII